MYCVVEVTQLSAEQFAQDELYDRLNAINERLNTLKIESEEVRRFCMLIVRKAVLFVQANFVKIDLKHEVSVLVLDMHTGIFFQKKHQ